MKRQSYLLSGLKNGRLLALFLSLGGLKAGAQDDFMSKTADDLSRYEATERAEKIYIQTDKSFYTAGEILWMKAYLVDAIKHQPYFLSKVAYVELISREAKPVLQAKLSMQNGSGGGSFFLPISLPSGSYKLRAYTSWMKNLGPDYFFEKNITVVNTQKREKDTLIKKAPVFDIQFFPEGGNLVEGFPTTIAFKAVDGNGIGVAAEGDVVDQDRKVVAHFISGLFGMGRFTLTAVAGRQYKAYVRFGQSDLTVVNFPVAISKGYALQVTSRDSNLVIQAFSSYEGDNRPLYLLIHTRGLVKYAHPLSVQNGTGSVTIPQSVLGEGISSITLFSGNQQAVCERLVFHMPKALNITALSEMEEYGVRKNVSATIRIDKKAGDNSQTDLGLSVYRLDSLQYQEGPDIRGYFYLSSDIRGYIEHPEYYFTHTGEATETGIDNLMLTQGWRRFKWDNVLQGKHPGFEFIPEWSGHLVNGKITDRITGQPMANQAVYLSGPAVKSQLAGCISNANGQMLFDFPRLIGSNALVMQAEDRTDSNYRLDIANPFSEKMSDHPFPPFKLKESLRDEFQFYNVGTQVQNVYLLDNLIHFRVPAYRDSTTFYGEPDKKFFLDDYTRFGTMEEVIREYVTGLTVNKRKGKFYFRLLNEQREFFDQDPLIVLDGVPVFSADEIMAIDPLKIKKIEVVNRKYYLGSLVASGIFAVYSYNNDMAGLQLSNRALIMEYEGLQMQREFYTPKYDQDKTDYKRIPDFRNVLIWKPDIRIGKENSATIHFYTSDRKGKYMGVVEGINDKGQAGSTRFFFEVN